MPQSPLHPPESGGTSAQSPGPAHNVIDTLARTIWGEARGEGREGMAAVASVILHRADHPGWWGSDIVSVCRRAYQFSCWNTDDPNYPKLLEVTGSDPSFVTALAVASAAVNRSLPDTTGGADSYADLRYCDPPWARGQPPTATVGHHTFFRLLIPGAAAPAAHSAPAPAVTETIAAPPPPAAEVVQAPHEEEPAQDGGGAAG